jgi:Asp-tRNA(Asn)/Glu-tRNA(Gln) amidotransferase B subunit
MAPMISETLQKTFAELRSIKPVEDHQVVALYRSLSVRRDFQPMWLAVMRNLHGSHQDGAVDPELEAFQKFVANDVVGFLAAEQTDFEELPRHHAGAGRSIYALSALSHRGVIRKDQARALLKEALSPQNVGVELEELLTRSVALDDEDDGALGAAVARVVGANAKAVEEYLGGKQKALGALMGQVMRDVKADPRAVEAAIKRAIGQA